jgi:hypothetical protein
MKTTEEMARVFYKTFSVPFEFDLRQINRSLFNLKLLCGRTQFCNHKESLYNLLDFLGKGFIVNAFYQEEFIKQDRKTLKSNNNHPKFKNLNSFFYIYEEIIDEWNTFKYLQEKNSLMDLLEKEKNYFKKTKNKFSNLFYYYFKEKYVESVQDNIKDVSKRLEYLFKEIISSFLLLFSEGISLIESLTNIQ